jgi:hypothetical protein
LVTSCVGTAFYSTLLKEMIEGTGRRGRRRKQLLDDLMGTRIHCKVEKAVDLSSDSLPDDDDVTGVYDRGTNTLTNTQHRRHDGLC